MVQSLPQIPHLWAHEVLVGHLNINRNIWYCEVGYSGKRRGCRRDLAGFISLLGSSFSLCFLSAIRWAVVLCLGPSAMLLTMQSLKLLNHEPKCISPPLNWRCWIFWPRGKDVMNNDLNLPVTFLLSILKCSCLRRSSVVGQLGQLVAQSRSCQLSWLDPLRIKIAPAAWTSLSHLTIPHGNIQWG